MSTPLSLNVHGQLLSLASPRVMGIINATPDSYFAASRVPTESAVAERVGLLREQGADILDIGAYSTRPGADDVSVQEERARLAATLRVVRREWPEAIVSIDTFRAEVAKACVEEYGADIVNDISGGLFDKRMLATVAALRVPYIIMHLRGTLQTMHAPTHYDDCATSVYRELAQRLAACQAAGINDVVLDPGFGFSKSVDDNYRLLAALKEFQRLGQPLLVGVSRKSMLWKPLGITPDEALPATTAVHILALQAGTHILRVHDVRTARQAIEIWRRVERAREPAEEQSI